MSAIFARVIYSYLSMRMKGFLTSGKKSRVFSVSFNILNIQKEQKENVFVLMHPALAVVVFDTNLVAVTPHWEIRISFKAVPNRTLTTIIGLKG